MFKRFGQFYFSPDDSGGGGPGSNGDQGGDQGDGDNKPPEPLVFDSWVKEQPDPVKTMLDVQTKGLKSALDSERESRKQLEKQVRDLAAKSEKDSEAQKKLTELADQMQGADRKADFYEAAHAAGVTNLKLAYTVAVQDEMFNRQGAVNFETMKQSYPELFGTPKPPPGNAGAGAGNPGPAKSDMNTFIRRAAGRTE